MMKKTIAIATALSLVLPCAAFAQSENGGTSGAGTPPAAAQTNTTKKGMAPGTDAAPTQTNSDSTGNDSGGDMGSGSSGH